jgi:HSP20 family molecular chaperone IbpA
MFKKGGIMHYDRSKNEVYRILNNANVLNTLNGGSVEPQINVNRNLHEYQVIVSVPGINREKIKIEIAEKHLLISHLIEFNMHNGNTGVIPHVIAACPLSLDIDHERITAEFQDGMVEVILPLSDFTSGYRREIKISN